LATAHKYPQRSVAFQETISRKEKRSPEDQNTLHELKGQIEFFTKDPEISSAIAKQRSEAQLGM
jgi:hypothetical protein